MSSHRFHNKNHRYSHHSTAKLNDNDSAIDPIGSVADPFKGNFYLSGLLSVSGDGDIGISDNENALDMHDNNIIRPATKTIRGVTRIATVEEVRERQSEDSIVNPLDLKELRDAVASNNTPHNLISNTHEDTALIQPLADGQIFKYDSVSGKWTNSNAKVVYQLATDLEAKDGVSINTAITPKQANIEFKRNRPFETINHPSEAGSGQTLKSIGTLAFQRYSWSTMIGTGNNGYAKKLYSYKLYRWNGLVWSRVDLYGQYAAYQVMDNRFEADKFSIEWTI